MSVVYVDPNAAEERWQTKLTRKFKENPFVPVGAGLTCWALIMAIRKTGPNGDSKSLNRWFRMRILFQGLTVVALMAGTYTMQQNQLVGANGLESEEEKRVTERLEFEARLRGAEEAHAFEQSMGDVKNKDERGLFEKLGLGRGSFKHREAARVAATTSEPTAPVAPLKSEPLPTPSTSGSGGWWNLFGGKSSGSDKN